MKTLKSNNEEIIESWKDFLDLLIPISVELGQTKLKIREIMDLEPSSIVKLSRSTGDGVNVCTDSHSLVRGEIIVIEDRAGVRINEIVINEK